MKEQHMADEAIYDDLFVTYAGRRMLRMAGGEIDQPEAPAEPDSPEAGDESGPHPDGGETPAEQQEQIDWEKRFKDTQSEFTRIAQENSELRRAQESTTAERQMEQALSDPDTQAQAIQSLVQQLGDDGAREWLEQHGFDVEDDDEDEEVFRDPRVDQLIQERQQEQQNAQVEQIEKQMETRLDTLAKTAEIELNDQLRNLLLDAAVSRFKDGQPDVEGVFNEWKAAADQQIKAYRQQKRSQRSTPPVPGSSGTPNPSLGDQQSRLALMNQIAEEAQQSS